MRNTSKSKIIVALIIVIIFIIITYFLITNKNTPISKDIGETSTNINTYLIEKKSYQPIVNLSAVVKAQQHTTISALVAGKVEHVYYAIGTKVIEGALLIAMDNESYLIKLEQKEAAISLLFAKIKLNNASCKHKERLLENTKVMYGLAEANYIRNKKLLEQNYSSAESFDRSREKRIQSKNDLYNTQFQYSSCLIKTTQLGAELKQAVANKKLAQKHLRETKIFAPYNAIITKKFVSKGRSVNIGKALLSMYNPNSVELESIIPDKYISLIKTAINNKQEIKACLHPNLKEDCFKLNRVGHFIPNQQTGELGFFKPLKVDNENILMDGKTLLIYLYLPYINAVAVPASALYSGNMIYRVINNHLQAVKVTILGSWYNKESQYFRLVNVNDLKTGDIILKNYLPSARNKLKVSVNDE